MKSGFQICDSSLKGHFAFVPQRALFDFGLSACLVLLGPQTTEKEKHYMQVGEQVAPRDLGPLYALTGPRDHTENPFNVNAISGKNEHGF